MRIKKILLCAISFFVSFVQAEVLEFPNGGFSIESLDSIPQQGMVQPIQMFLPAVNGFAANVNVQIQAYSGTIQDYKKLSEGQFKQIGLTLISSEDLEDSIVLEYMGPMGSLTLHWYAKAFKKMDHVYLVTATATHSDWEATKEKLISTVNSFKLNET